MRPITTTSTELEHHKVPDEFNAKVSEMGEGEVPPVFASMQTVLLEPVLQLRYTLLVVTLVASFGATLWSWANFLLFDGSPIWFIVQGALVPPVAVLWWIKGARPMRIIASVLDKVRIEPARIQMTKDGSKAEPVDPSTLAVQVLFAEQGLQIFTLRHRIGLAALGGVASAALWGYILLLGAVPGVLLALPATFGVFTLIARSRYYAARSAVNDLKKSSDLRQAAS